MREKLAVRTRAAVAGMRPVDLVVGLGLLAIGLADALTTDEYTGGRPRLLVAVVLQTLPLVWQRIHTVAAVALSLLGVAVEVAGQEAYGGAYAFLGFLLLVHAVARWTGGASRRRGVALLIGGVVVHSLSQSGEGPLGMLGAALLVVAFGGAAWTLGRLGRQAFDREQDLLREADAHESAWRARNAEVIEEERARISRELHDVVGHALAGISLTAGAAEQQDGARDPQMATALALIRNLSRDAASDVRRLVALLREDPESGGATEPQPRVDALPNLIERARAAGLRVELNVDGAPVPIPGGVHLAAYRVVQEGLTNVARHAASAPAQVRLTWLPGRLEVAVENEVADENEVVRKDPAVVGGRGLVGLRERVHVFGGALVARKTEQGGFLLSAGFPLP